MAGIEALRKRLGEGLVIPACPLPLTSRGEFNDERLKSLLRYYVSAGAGGVAVAVHTTQFAIREPSVGLFRPVLECASELLGTCAAAVKISGICGGTGQAVEEA